MSLEKLVTISSDDKDPDSVSNSNFWVTLKESYYTQNINRILIKECTVPNCFYNLSDGNNNGKQNNVLNYVDENKINKSFEIVPGQYNIDQFITALTAGFASNGDGVLIQQDELTQKLVFSFPFFKTIRSTSLISPVLGVTDDLKCIGGIPTKSHFPPDLSGINAVNVHSSILGESNGIDGNSGLINLLERVSLHDIPFGSFGYKQNNDNDLAMVTYAQPKNLQRIDIRLRDTQGNILNIGTKKMSLIIKVYFA
jgi:hypothetical protein